MGGVCRGDSHCRVLYGMGVCFVVLMGRLVKYTSGVVHITWCSLIDLMPP